MYSWDKAAQAVAEEMVKLGAELIDNQWCYHGKLELVFLIRSEDERRIWDYIADELESIGFQVERFT